VDSHCYSNANLPPHSKYGSTWEPFIGPVTEKALNKRHNDYLRINLYVHFFNDSLRKYLKHHNIKYLRVDSSTINNKYCAELEKHLLINKNRTDVKISIIVDDIDSPLMHTFVEPTSYNSSIAIDNTNDMVPVKLLRKYLRKLTDRHIYWATKAPIVIRLGKHKEAKHEIYYFHNLIRDHAILHNFVMKISIMNGLIKYCNDKLFVEPVFL